MDERTAVTRLRGGDISGLEPLVRAYQMRALRTAYLITRDRAAAEDIVQEAFVRATGKIGQLRSDAAFGPWFLRIVANDAIKAAARAQRWTTPIPLDRAAVLMSQMICTRDRKRGISSSSRTAKFKRH